MSTGRILTRVRACLILLACAWLISPGAGARDGNSDVPRQGAAAEMPLRVLFVGNSYLYYNDSLHNHVRRMVSELFPELAPDLKYKSATIGGARLKHHNIDWLLEPGRIGVDEPFQAVVLQGGSSEVLNEKSREEFFVTVQQYAERIRDARGKPFLYMTHAYVAPHKRVSEGMINTVADAYLKAGAQAHADVIPVGLAFAESYRRRPDLLLHKQFDGSHPNLHGTYLAACVVTLSLYGGPLDRLEYDYYDALPESDVKYLQSVASDVVRAFRSAADGEVRDG